MTDAPSQEPWDTTRSNAYDLCIFFTIDKDGCILKGLHDTVHSIISQGRGRRTSHELVDTAHRDYISAGSRV